MKILQINVSEGGSTGHIASAIHRRLLRDGEESLFLYGRGTNALQTVAGRYCSALFTRLTGNVGAFCKKETERFISAIDAFRPDCVHLHNLHGYYVNISKILNHLKVAKIPTVITLHDEFLYTGRCAFSGDCVRWQMGCGGCPHKAEYPAVFSDKTAKLLQEKKELFSEFPNLSIVSPSKWLARRAKVTYLKEHPISVIPNGIETDIFRPGESKLREAYHITEEHIVFSAAQGLMLPRKGGKHIVALAQAMPNVRFLLAGAEEGSYPPNVTVLPATSEPERMAELYRGADVFLIASREDNFPTVCLEAAACGTPVAGFLSGGTGETVSPDISRFVPYGDLDALKHSTEKLFLLTDKKENATHARDAEEMYQAYKILYIAAKSGEN